MVKRYPAILVEGRGSRVRDAAGRALASSTLWLGTWTTPIDLELGNAYLTPAQTNNLVRLNLGLSSASLARAASVRLDAWVAGKYIVLTQTEPAGPPSAALLKFIASTKSLL